MTGTPEGARKAVETSRRRYGKSRQNKSLTENERYIVRLTDRWLNVHDIRAMGERAVRETA